MYNIYIISIFSWAAPVGLLCSVGSHLSGEIQLGAELFARWPRCLLGSCDQPISELVRTHPLWARALVGTVHIFLAKFL